MKTRYKKIVAVVALMSVTAIAVAWRVQQYKAARPKVIMPVAKRPEPAPIPYDHALLDTFSKVSALMDITHRPSTYNGTLTMTDKADSSHNIKAIPFLLSCNGNAYYYHYGNTETLNNSGFYLYIDNDMHKILVGAQKQISVMGLGNIAVLKADMINERYTLSKSVTGAEKTIRFLNEKHISCKEYALTYDTAAMKIKRIYIRMPEIRDALNPRLEKTIDIKFINWVATSDIDRLLRVKDVITVQDSVITLKNRYKAYQLIRI